MESYMAMEAQMYVLQSQVTSGHKIGTWDQYAPVRSE